MAAVVRETVAEHSLPETQVEASAAERRNLRRWSSEWISLRSPVCPNVTGRQESPPLALGDG